VRTGRTKSIVVDAPCAPAQLGVACCPCRGFTPEAEYASVAETVRRGLTEDPRLLLEPLERRMHALAEQERFEEAAQARDRLRALVDALQRRRLDHWLTAGRLSLRTAAGDRIELAAGSLVGAASAGLPAAAPIGWPPPRERADELAVVRSWVRRHAPIVDACEDAPADPVDGGAELARLLERIRKSDDPRPSRATADRATRQNVSRR
jgi:hypothetical protein